MHRPRTTQGCQCAACKAHIFNPTRLVAARKRRAMGRHDLATAIGLSSVAVLGRIERGESSPTGDVVERFSSALGFPMGFFYAHDLPELRAEMCS